MDVRPGLVSLALCLSACGGGRSSEPDAGAQDDASDSDAGGDTDTGVDSDADSDTDGESDTDLRPPDPLELGALVSQEEIEQTIADLEALGTRQTFTSGDELARDYLVSRLEGYGIAAELDELTVVDEQVANVIGRKEGLVDPTAVWVFSAHYDSTSTDRDHAPGADDNASGVAAVLEAARILADAPMAQSLWFVFTAGEEQGAVGSHHMASWLARDHVDVRGVMAPDMIAYWPLGDADSFDILGDGGSLHLVMQMADVADALGVGYRTWIEHGYCYGDDHTSFQEAGFPAISPMDCVEAHNLPDSGESTPHYHETSDTMDTLYLPFTARVVQVLVATFASWGDPQ